MVVEERWDMGEDAGADAAAALWRRHPGFTAIACVADTYALGVLQWAGEHHIEVPRHLSVAGHDDIASTRGAGLTTVSQPFTDKGCAAAAMLLGIIDGAPPRQLVLPTTLQQRVSSGHVPTRQGI